MIAREIGLARQTVHTLCQVIQANAARLQPQEPLPDRQTETDEMFQNAGEKGNPIAILMTHHANEPTNGVDTAPMTMTDHPLSVQLAVRAGRCACGWFIIPTKRPWSAMSILSPWPIRWFPLMSGKAMSTSFVCMQPAATATRSGRVTTMEMVSARCTLTPAKGRGPRCVTSCVLIVACIRNTLAAVSPCANSASTSSELPQRSSRLWSLCTRLGHEPFCFSDHRCNVCVVLARARAGFGYSAHLLFSSVHWSPSF